MRITMSAKFQNYFLFLAVCLLTLCTSVAHAQTTNLEATQWQAMPFSMANIDGSITVITSTYIFDKQGKATLFVLATKGVGAESQAILASPSYDPQVNSPFERRLVLTAPIASSSQEIGTYKITGKSIYLDFPGYTISATINGDVMKGVSTDKKTNKKEDWLVEKFIPENKSTNSVNDNKNSYSGNSTDCTMTPNSQACVQIAGSKTPSNKSIASKFLKTLPQQVIEKYNPTKLTSNTISGNLSGNGEKYFYFTAIPGDLTITLTITADAQSSLNSVWATLFDPNETSPYSEYRMLGYATTMTNYGRTTQNTQKITFSERMPVLLQIKASNNLGTGKYKVQLEGTYEIE